MEHNRQTQIIESKDISDNLKIVTSVTFDEKRVYLDIDYMEGKFTIQRNFNNNYIGLEKLSEFKEQFSNEEYVRTYFGI